MTKPQIKAELRRSAMEDSIPWYGCDVDAFVAAIKWAENFPIVRGVNDETLRNFYLLVAEAL